MRLIDADVLKTRFEPKQAYFTEAIVRKIDTEIAIKEPQWIPCSERLPEDSNYYLVTTSWGMSNRYGSPIRKIMILQTLNGVKLMIILSHGCRYPNRIVRLNHMKGRASDDDRYSKNQM